MLLHSQSQSQCDRVGTRYRGGWGARGCFLLFLRAPKLRCAGPDSAWSREGEEGREVGRADRRVAGRPHRLRALHWPFPPTFDLSSFRSSLPHLPRGDLLMIGGAHNEVSCPRFLRPRPSVRPSSSAVRRSSVDPTVSRSVDPFPPSTVFRNSSSGIRRRHLRARSQARDPTARPLPRRNPSWRPPTRASSA